MNIINVEMQEKIGTTIEFKSDTPISIKSNLNIDYNDRIHYFEVMSTRIGLMNELIIKAREIGHYRTKFDRINNFDLREIIGLQVNIITDKDILRQIQIESGWC